MTTRDIAPTQRPAAAPALTPYAGSLIGASQLLRAIGGQSYTDLSGRMLLMRRIISSTYTTLDGFIDNPHLWSMRYNSEDLLAYAADMALSCDALLLGRATYEGMAQAWPDMGGNPYADHINAIPKYAVTSTLDKPAEWDNSHLLPGDELVQRVTALRGEPGRNILIWGCGRLTDELAVNGLLDEYRLWVCPVIKGDGEPLFRPDSVTELEHADTVTFDSGVVVLTYRPLPAAS